MQITKSVRIAIAVVIISLLGLTALVVYQAKISKTSTFSNQSILTNGELVVPVEIVDDIASRVRGLSGRESLPEDSGMLFVFSELDFHGIWMKDMNFSLDIIWFDENLRVVNIKREATPESYPTVFRPTTKSLYVLEVNTGFAEKAGIKIGQVFNLSQKVAKE